MKGYCDIQKKDAVIQIEIDNCSSLEDVNANNKYDYGRIACNHASMSNQCNGKNCSILKQHGIKK